MSCPHINLDRTGRCLFCGELVDNISNNSRSNWNDPINPFDMAKAIKAKREKERREGIPQLSQCPTCRIHALFYDKINDRFECLNLKCSLYSNSILPNTDLYKKINDLINNSLNNSSENCSRTSGISDEAGSIKKEIKIFENVIWPESGASEIAEGNQHTFSNPMLISVKMFLADKRSWVKEYREDEYTCVDFAKDVLDFMTQKEIRCGYVVIRFDNGEGHAIVAFETDYGLVYFEPQTGDQEYPQIGKPYRSQLQGIPDNSLVTEIEIKWNC